MSDDSIIIAGENIPLVAKTRNISELRFYKDNPRIHSIVHGEHEPTEENIFSIMSKRDHVQKTRSYDQTEWWVNGEDLYL